MNRPLLRPDLTPLRGSRDFRAVFTSRTVAMLGSQAAEVALLVQAKQLTGSPLVVELLGMAELVPLLLLGLYGGVLADRFDRRALMRWCGPGLACCARLLLLNALLPRPALWPLYVVSALMMAIAAVQRPSFEAAISLLVPREQLAGSPASSRSASCVPRCRRLSDMWLPGPGKRALPARTSLASAARW